MRPDDDYIQGLVKFWQDLKKEEQQVTKQRREVEDQIRLELGLEDEMVQSFKGEGFKYEVRMNHKIDAQELEELAKTNGLEGYLRTLFRHKPELNAKAWDNAPEEVKQILGQAITTKPARPTFKIV